MTDENSVAEIEAPTVTFDVVKDVVSHTKDRSVIEASVKLAGSDEFIPITVSKDSTEPHMAALYADLHRGKFGKVAVKSVSSDTTRNKKRLRASFLADVAKVRIDAVCNRQSLFVITVFVMKFPTAENLKNLSAVAEWVRATEEAVTSLSADMKSDYESDDFWPTISPEAASWVSGIMSKPIGE